MKQWLSFIFILTSLIWLMPNLVHANKAVIQVDHLNIRSGPSLSHSIIGKAHNDETYQIVDRKDDWVQIQWNDKKGWVAGYLVKMKKEQPVTSEADHLRVRSEPTSLGEVTVTAAILNVRSQSSTNSSVIAQVSKGKTFTYIAESKGWYQIKLDDTKTGWVAGWLVTSDAAENSTTSRTEVTKVTLQFNGTNIRSGPSSDTTVLARAHKGEQFNVLGKEDQWYKIQYKGKEAYVAGWIVKEETSSNAPPPVPSPSAPSGSGGLDSKTIVVDAGHGGFDPGSIGVSGSYEKTLTLQTAQQLKQTLEQNGAQVIMTRSNDSYVSLSARTIISNASQADLFISVHYNSYPQAASATGINTYYYHSNAKSLASNIQSGMVGTTKLRDRGIRHGDFHVLRNNNKPAVLLELGFLSNPNEEQTVSSTSYQKKVSQGIKNGLENYFN
ncbi:N-acetylmuramoyl-L-alanine amidase [Halobacillus naozhouensis]|uniref:N-acetylmuramoyl-L-alanine amidase n=1 Tax=Halobacillus naozhouensis TaxID=554880 RepID=A0ABY8IVK9_9BACI|nr:N-acetylmuramoyl-L-alanine amidase [Halobacillus naozhouensis]WFT73354.1 N-acetylmuramoyl-L-alanine amidase [Halobacillus naozhouensis]